MSIDPSFRFAIAAVDAVILGIHNGELQVLVREIETENDQYRNLLGFPGGVMRPDENAEVALARHLKDKAGLTKIYTEQLYTFTDINRDARSRAVAISYLALVPPDVVAQYNHPRAKFVLVKGIKKLAYDHGDMLAVAQKRLAGKLLYTTIAQMMLPKFFTLSELQSVYEIARGEVFDKRNFRKKILALDIIKDSGEVQSGVANRPASLYSFVSTSVIEVPQIAGM
jgi:8-oxo-dGTP diphosphatase